MSHNRHVWQLKTLEPGDHLCLIFERDEEHQAVLAPFLREGLEQGEKVLYITDVHSEATILDYLRQDGVEVEAFLRRGQLCISHYDEVYTKAGAFDPDAMIDLLREETAQALAEGYTALRVTGEMSWVLRELPGSMRLIEYEVRLNEFFPGSKCLAICQYDRRCFEPSVLLDVLSTHPIAFVGAKMYKNTHYIPPAELFYNDPAAVRLDHWIQSLEDYAEERRQTDAAIQSGESRYRLLFEETLNPILVVDTACRYVDANQAALDFLECEKDELLNKVVWDFSPPGSLERDRQKHAPFVARRNLETEYFVNGKIKTLLLNVVPLTLSGETHLYGIGHDITERKETEAKLKESEARYRKLVETTPNSILVLKDQRYIFANPAAASMLGYDSPDELVGVSALDTIAPHHHQMVIERMKRAAADDVNPPVELDLLRPDGTTMSVESTSISITLEGEPATLIIGYDLTPRKQAEAARQESEALLLAFTNALPDLGFIIDEDGRYVEVFAHQDALLYVDADHLRGRLLHDVLPATVADLILSAITRTIEGGKSQVVEYALDAPAGHYWFEGRTAVMPTTSSPVRRVVLVARDITERKRTEKALEASEKKYRDLVNALNEGIWAIDQDSITTFVNPYLAEMLGYNPDEMLGKHWFDFMDERGVGLCKYNLARRHRGIREQQDFEFIRKDGSRIYARLETAPLTDDKGDYIGTVAGITNITELRYTEEALRRERDFAESLVDTAQVIILVLDAEGRIVRFNPYMEEITGYKLEEVQGKDWFSVFLPERDRDHVRALFLKAIDDVQTQGNVNPIVTKDGRERYIEWYDKTLKDADGHVIGLLSTGQDITERRQADAELRQSTAALKQRAAQLALLNKIGREVAALLEPDELLARIARLVHENFGYQHVGIFTLDHEQKALVMKASAGEYAGRFPRDHRLKVGEGIVGWVAQHVEIVLANDINVEPRFRNPFSEAIIKAELSVPLKVGKDAIGVLDVQSREINAFNQDDITVLETLADQIAVSIENARLYKQAQQDAETKVTLLREINHRVRNNLTTIIGLLEMARSRLWAKSEETQAGLFDLLCKVHGLAALHSILSASEWTPVSLEELTNQVVNVSLQILPIEKHIDVNVVSPDTTVSPDQAHHLTLVLNELLTNATKYGWHGRNVMQIGVDIAVDDDQVQLRFRDDGSGYPDVILQQKQMDSGLGLVHGIVYRNLGGELSLYNDSGAVVVIRFTLQRGR